MIYLIKNRVLKRIVTTTCALSVLASAAFADDGTTPGAVTAYSIVLSLGSGPNDQDIIVTKQEGEIYTFKYCSAHDKDGKETPVTNLRSDLYAHPDRYLGDSKDFSQVMGDFFQEPACETIGGRPFGFDQSVSLETHHKLNDLAFPLYLMSGLGLSMAGTGLISGYYYGRKLENTTSTLRFIFSKHFPSGYAFFTALAASTLAGVTWSHHQAEEDKALVNDLNSAMPRDSHDRTAKVNLSMPDFRHQFELELQKAIKQRALVPL